MRQDLIALAIQITTKGDPKPNVYRITSWLSGQGYLVFVPEIREALGVAGNQIDHEAALGLGKLLTREHEQSLEEEAL